MKKIISLILSLILVCAVFFGDSVCAGAVSVFNVGGNAFRTVDFSKKLAPGITEEHIVTYKKNSLDRNSSYVATIDFSKKTVGMLAGYRDYDSSGKWGLQTVTAQAKAATKATGKRIVVAVNGDFFVKSGKPVNLLRMNGKTVNASKSNYYFGILKNGKPVIRKASVSTADVTEAVGTNLILLSGGKIAVSAKNKALAPRTALGITADGKVIVMVTDGRSGARSVGYTLYETAEMMRALGCVDALNFDGGGSSTYCSAQPGKALTVKNKPSDGSQRAVSSTILFYSNAK